jgi:hypothetical protein
MIGKWFVIVIFVLVVLITGFYLNGNQMIRDAVSLLPVN